MKKTTLKYDRETAIGFLNDFYDKIGVEEENRIDSNMNEIEEEKLERLKAKGASEEEISDYTERCDVDREKIITAIRRGQITFDENGDLVQVLDYPISLDGVVVVDKLKYSTGRKKVDDIDKATANLRKETHVQRYLRLLSLRTGVMITHLRQLDEESDGTLANLIMPLFLMPYLPLK